MNIHQTNSAGCSFWRWASAQRQFLYFLLLKREHRSFCSLGFLYTPKSWLKTQLGTELILNGFTPANQAGFAIFN